MIIRDTSVLSALVHTEHEEEVVGGLDRQPTEAEWITSITMFEVPSGLVSLPHGDRWGTLKQSLARVLPDHRENCILEFGCSAVRRQMLGQCPPPTDRITGRVVDFPATQTAAIPLLRYRRNGQ